MADLHIPDDVLEAQRAYDAADTHVQELSSTLPFAADVVAGEASISDEQRAQLQDARDERLRLLRVLRDHPWWREAGDPLKAESALRKVARSNDDGVDASA